ncbi:hypothetical protein [Streptomyces odonnellii]|uniref:hypothetical protein n=1 Tax=Streptomyces odonnellii TaxID=1417980 RepID=UPI000B06FAED|nr:hypothetical protein [Streptomyces odonnellii]
MSHVPLSRLPLAHVLVAYRVRASYRITASRRVPVSHRLLLSYDVHLAHLPLDPKDREVLA